MFPRPIEQAPKHRRLIYQLLLPVSLFIWLLPLLAIFMTSIRSAKDINTGNVFGWPSSFEMFANYSGVFIRSNAGQYFLNSIWITIPTVAVSISLACLAGYALAIYRFRWSMPLFFLFIAGNFVPFQILMVPVRDLSVQTGLYNTVTGLVLFHAAFQTGFCTLFMRNFIRALPFELIESARIDGAGRACFAADPTGLSSSGALPGETWQFQGWFRDVDGAGALTSNTSTAVEVLLR